MNKQKLREFSTTKPALQQIPKGPYIANKHKRKERPTKTNTKQSRKMPIGTYISIINLNVNGLNVSTKSYRLNGYKNKTHMYAAYRRPTSDLETHTD